MSEPIPAPQQSIDPYTVAQSIAAFEAARNLPDIVHTQAAEIARLKALLEKHGINHDTTPSVEAMVVLMKENERLRAALEVALPCLAAIPTAPLGDIYKAAAQVRAALGK